MKIASLVIGIIVLAGMLIGFIPCLGWFNWFNIPLALIGLILGIIDYTNNNKISGEEFDPLLSRANPFPTGALLCGIALFLSSIRLVLGGGIV